MINETPSKRKTRLALGRKRAQRKREHDKKLAMGAFGFKMEMYRGTRRELEQIRGAAGFDETEHALTITIHAVAALSRCAPTAFRDLMKKGTT